MRALGLDLGSKRIGVAVSDRSGTIASPLTVLARGRSRRDDHQRIAELVRDEEAELVVVGLPRSLSGGDGPAAKAARAEAPPSLPWWACRSRSTTSGSPP